MQLPLSPEEILFQHDVRDFLDSQLSEDIAFANRVAPGVWAPHDKVLQWQRTLNKRGWAAPSWPTEYGGTDWSPMQTYLFELECARAGAPSMIGMSLKMVGPVIARFGTQAQKDYYLPRILDTQDYWCQGFSEPGAGSDLASLKCKAELDGDHYVVNGTKLWTTEAHHANKIFNLVRTSTAGKPQAGISFLLMDMDMPGISVAPIISISSDHEVNQVFFDSVRVPKENLVGNQGQGWECAKYLLEFERGGGMQSERIKSQLEELKKLAAHMPEDGESSTYLSDDPQVKQAIAELEIRNTALTLTELRIVDAMSGGGNPGAESSMLKIEFTELQQLITELATDMLGPRISLLERSRPMHEVITDELSALVNPVLPKYLNFRAASIYGGTNEVQRNIIAKAVLGL